MLMLADVSPCFQALETFLGPEKLEKFVRTPDQPAEPVLLRAGHLYPQPPSLSPGGTVPHFSEKRHFPFGGYVQRADPPVPPVGAGQAPFPRCAPLMRCGPITRRAAMPGVTAAMAFTH